ncbi:MAG: hypothetical protein KAS36_05115 [Anaerolineales bacterium]|nr:hypothetical protein [Anaerolineales bacterium]
MARPTTNDKSRKANVSAMAIEDLIVDQIRLKQVAEKSAVDFDRISESLRVLTGQEISKELLKNSWDLLRVLLAESIELRDRAMIHAIIGEIIKRKEPKQQQIKTDLEVDHRVLVLVQGVEEKTIEELIARRNAITVRDSEDRPIRAIPDRRDSGKKKS